MTAKGRRKGCWRFGLGLLIIMAALSAIFGLATWNRIKTGARLLKNRNRQVREAHNIVYHRVDGVDLTLDVYRPEGEPRPLPGLLMIHGGSWNSGNKEQLADLARPLAQQGYVAVCINYRLAPRWRYPAPANDARFALRWMREHAAEYGIQPDRIGAAGFSAGAQIAALLGTTARDEADRLQCVVAVSGPYNFYRFEDAPDNTSLAYYFGGAYRQAAPLYRDASPILHASAGDAPFLLISGADDTVVLPENDDLLAEALRKHGVPVQTIRVRNAGHVLAPVDGRPIEPSYPVVMLRVAEFLQKYLG